ncbi:hypothetical protein GCM10023231_25690 [Olivibacter ginsenosidimutans]|uniref:Uncharacterized protein n=1 Tax=Olivibacter ginsenosidimutans TaxID=1176537 RepID=A0ABP9BL72_9SPHI
MNDELKDRKSDKQTITEKSGKKKIIEVNTGESFAERHHHRKNEGPTFTNEPPTENRS